MMKQQMVSLWKDLRENRIQIFLLLALWIVLFERLDWFVFLTGMLAAVSVVLFTDRYLLRGRYPHYYTLKPAFIVKYIFYLIKEIFSAGFQALPKAVGQKADSEIVHYTTRLTHPLLINILANSITLTPGTVTVEKNKSQLKVLTFMDPDTRTEDKIPQRLEQILLDYEKQLEGK